MIQMLAIDIGHGRDRRRQTQERAVAFVRFSDEEVASPQSGIRDPRREVWNDSAFGASYNAFDSDRYVLTFAREWAIPITVTMAGGWPT